MNDEIFALLDTEETLAISEEDNRRYAGEIEEYRNRAVSLLANVRHLMTGSEIHACEAATNGESFDGAVIDRLANQFPRESATL